MSLSCHTDHTTTTKVSLSCICQHQRLHTIEREIVATWRRRTHGFLPSFSREDSHIILLLSEPITLLEIAHSTEELHILYRVLPTLTARDTVIVFEVWASIATLHTPSLITLKDGAPDVLGNGPMCALLFVENKLT